MASISSLFKKSQGISITVIVIAAIALLVLAVIAAIFLGRMNFFGRRLDEVGNICQLPGTERVCCEEGSANAIANPLTGKWADCAEKCCEAVAQRDEEEEAVSGTKNNLRAFDIIAA